MNFNKQIVAILVLLCLSSNGYSQKNARSPKGFAIVELFTSEGCSSCPAAEATLDRIQAAHREHVYVMEFHVDYWDYLGWKDTFSKHEFTLRQQKYVQQLRLGGAYTPQAVVNGQYQVVGSDQQKLDNAIGNVLSSASTQHINIDAKNANGAIQADYKCSKVTGEVVHIALVQKYAETNVKRGENGGRKLKHINVVRDLRSIDNDHGAGKATFTLPPGLSPKDCSIIAFCQNKRTGVISCASGREL